MFKFLSPKFFFSSSQKTVYIVAGKRTPIGSFLVKLSKFKGPEFASIGAGISIEGPCRNINKLCLRGMK